MNHHWHGMPVYSLSKIAAGKAAGIIGASVEEKFRVLAIHPGRMDTDMGHESAQIRPEEAAEGIYELATGQRVPESWYVDYLGRKMEHLKDAGEYEEAVRYLRHVGKAN